jgi:hypothetical protein
MASSSRFDRDSEKQSRISGAPYDVEGRLYGVK